MSNGTSRKRLSFDSLKHLDNGVINAAFDQEVAACVRDCEDRAGVNSPRKITMEFLMTPVVDQGNNFESVDVEVIVKPASIPSRRSRPYAMRTLHDGTLSFQPDSPRNPDQEALPFANSNNEDDGDSE